MFKMISSEALEEGLFDSYNKSERNLLQRWSNIGERWERRGRLGLDPYQKSSIGRIAPYVSGAYRDGKKFEGVNFASQDYLSLSSHPEILKAVISGVDEFGVHSAGSAALMGNTQVSLELEAELASFLRYSDCVVFPIGWAAGYGIVKTLVRESDYVVIDVLAHACLQEAARDATSNVVRCPHLSLEGLERRLSRIRSKNSQTGILVVTETLFSMDSDVPDIRLTQELCHRYGATLLVDCAHDLGSIGENGRGILEDQDMVGAVDVLMGSFSKTFASTGGFVAFNNGGLRFGLRGNCGPSTFTNAMTPLQASIVLAALRVVQSSEGRERRNQLHRNSDYLRNRLHASRFTILGQSSAIVPTVIGEVALARLMTFYAIEAGGIVNLVEHPAVARNACRWRLQVMSSHTEAHIERMTSIAVSAREQAGEHLRFIASGQL